MVKHLLRGGERFLDLEMLFNAESQRGYFALFLKPSAGKDFLGLYYFSKIKYNNNSSLRNKFPPCPLPRPRREETREEGLRLHPAIKATQVGAKYL